MINRDLVQDYIMRCRSRYRALELYFSDENFADVVRESQELVELALKAVLRSSNIDPPRIHDVSQIFEENKERLPDVFQKHLRKVIQISHSLRRDRELAFYGTEDLTPSQFYKREDAEQALMWARQLLDWITEAKL